MYKVMDETDEASVRSNLIDDIKLRWGMLGVAVPVCILYSVLNKYSNLVPLMVIMALTAVANYFYYYFLNRDITNYRGIFFAEALGDIALIAAGIVYTGGMASSLYLVYLFMLLDGAFDYWTGNRYYIFLSMTIGSYFVVYLMLNSGQIPGPNLFNFAVRSIFMVAIGLLANSLASEIRTHHTDEKKDDAEKARLYEEIKKSNLKLEENVRKATENLERTNLMLVKKNISLLAAHEIYKTANESKDKAELLEMILGIIVPLMKGHGGIIFSANDVKNRLRIESLKKLDWAHDLKAGMDIEIMPDSELYGALIRRQAFLYEDIEDI
jgi:hypothetical protein